jgi:hypothetical protein
MDQASYFRSHPPRCIAGFIDRPAQLPGVESDGAITMTLLNPGVPMGLTTLDDPALICSVFALSCRCGGNRHYIHCYRSVNPDFDNATEIGSPIVLECAACGTMTELLDSEVHGFNREVHGQPITLRSQGDPIVFECPTCGRQPLEAFPRFEYQDDLFDSYFAEFGGREQDLFGWFNLVARCPQCSQVLLVADLPTFYEPAEVKPPLTEKPPE